MKYVLSLSCFLFLLPTLQAEGNSEDSILRTYSRTSGKNNLYVLQLKKGGTYDHCRYTDKKTYHDYGTYELRHGKIIFKSLNKKRGFSSVGNKTLYVNEDGIYPTRIKAILHKQPVVEADQDRIYDQDWSYNPLTKTQSGNTVTTPIVPSAPKSNFGYDQNFSAADFVKTYYNSITTKYAPTYASVMENHYCGPGCYLSVVNGQTVPWEGDTTTSALFTDFETTIHETVHHCNAFDNCLVQPGIEIYVPQTDHYTSSEFKSIVPAGGADKIFRYDTYVGDDSKVSANVWGIYGLLDEFSAYQNGCTAAEIAAETALLLGEKDRAKQFISQARGTYFAYYEFSLFIAWYLEFAKVNYPEQHKKFMENKNLRVAFTLNADNFQATITKLAKLDKQLSGSSTSEFDGNSGYGVFTKEELPKHDATITAFRVKGVNTLNYLSFLEPKK